MVWTLVRDESNNVHFSLTLVSKKLAPTWEELATEFKAEGKTVNIASVDCTQFPSLGKRFEVSGYPTLVKLHQGTSEEYVSGNRAKTSLREWAVTIPVPKTIQQRAEETFKLIVRQFEIMINHALAAGVILILLGFLFGMLIALLFFTRTKLIYVDDPGLKASTANPAAAKKPAKKVD